MSASDVMCFSSDQEGLPVALMEGRDLGLPVVATAAGGLADHVHDMVDGLLVPTGEAAVLADAILRLDSNLDLLRVLASNSGKTAAAYDARRFVERVEQDYLQLVGTRGKSSAIGEQR